MFDHLPTIHLNGSGRENLTAGYAAMHRAIEVAIDAMVANSPHGRDYYVKPGSYELAATVYQSRLSALREVSAAIMADWLELTDRGL
jgi:hypothetical protein